MKAAMVNRGYVDKKLAPSYFLECLIYNSDNINFRKNGYNEIAISIINQFDRDLKNGMIINYLVQNEQDKLFGTSDLQWNIEDATTFVTQLIKFWNEYK